MKITYNAPVSSTLAIFSALILSFDTFLGSSLLTTFSFAPSQFHITRISDYLRIFSSLLGHQSWQHFLINISIILLLGPLLERRYRSWRILMLVLVSTLISALISGFVTKELLIGSNEVAFMMLILASITLAKKDELPVSFILATAVYLLSEFFPIFADVAPKQTHIAQIMAGAVTGLLFLPRKS